MKPTTYIIIVTITLLIIGVIISGCIDTTTSQQSNVPKQTHLKLNWVEDYSTDNANNCGTIAEVEIPEKNIICYTFDNYEGGGISCLYKNR